MCIVVSDVITDSNPTRLKPRRQLGNRSSFEIKTKVLLGQSFFLTPLVMNVGVGTVYVPRGMWLYKLPVWLLLALRLYYTSITC